MGERERRDSNFYSFFPPFFSSFHLIEFGFAMCPPDLLEVIVQSLSQWSRSPIFAEVLPFLLEDLPIFMEISRQAFSLDPNHFETIEKAVSLFKAWFIESNILTGTDEQNCWQVAPSSALFPFLCSSLLSRSHLSSIGIHEEYVNIL